ncbi:hypothetical protein ASA1KI_31350 [Opitutales bacterium ASA1]|nr:hypothetical protein ASA1KI_31350 [Opitutales bacterium ASA1]
MRVEAEGIRGNGRCLGQWLSPGSGREPTGQERNERMCRRGVRYFQYRGRREGQALCAGRARSGASVIGYWLAVTGWERRIDGYARGARTAEDGRSDGRMVGRSDPVKAEADGARGGRTEDGGARGADYGRRMLGGSGGQGVSAGRVKAKVAP